MLRAQLLEVFYPIRSERVLVGRGEALMSNEHFTVDVFSS
jgi:hypothetical protein